MTRAMLAAVAAAGFLAGTDPGPIGGVITLSDPHHPDNASWDCFDIGYAKDLDAYLSVVVDVTNGNRLKARRVDPDDGSTGPVIDLGVQTTVRSPSVSWNPLTRRFLLVYLRGTALYGMMLNETGQPLDASPGEFQISPSVYLKGRAACDGSNWLVAWDQASGDVMARRIGGTSTNAAPQFLSTAFAVQASGNMEWLCDVAFGAGADYLVVWRDQWDHDDYSTSATISGRTVSPSGTLGPVQEYAKTADHTWWYPMGSSAVVTANGTRGEFLVAWVGKDYISEWFEDEGDSDPRAILVDASGYATGPALRLEGLTGSISRTSISVACNEPSGQYLLSWLQMAGGAAQVRAARLPGDLSSYVPDILIHEHFNGGSTYGRVASAGRTRSKDFQVILQWGNDDSTQPKRIEAQRYSLGADPNAPVVSAIEQRELGGAAIPPGATIVPAGLALGAAVSGGSVRIEAEVREVGVPFSDSPTHVGEMTPVGMTPTPLRLTVTSVEHGKPYHWQVRAVNAFGLPSVWFAFGSDPDKAAEADVVIRANQVPVATSPGQFLDGKAIPPGEVVYAQHGLRFKVAGSDADGDAVSLEVEARPVGTAFSGIPTAIGSFSPGGTAEVVEEFSAAGVYRWQYRLRDAALGTSPWTEFGGNAGAADFRLMSLGSAGLSCAHGARASVALPLILLAALLVRRA